MAVSTRSNNDSIPQTPQDPGLAAFENDTFDPITYLNSVLPAVHIESLASTSLSNLGNSHTSNSSNTKSSLTDASTKTKALLTQWTAQCSRLCAHLTQQTDEILRGGGRLAYEVDLLRGETSGLTELLDGRLRGEMDMFDRPAAPSEDIVSNDLTKTTSDAADTLQRNQSEIRAPDDGQDQKLDYMTQLRTLNLVRTRLDTVIKTFGDAMSWPLSPSLLTTDSTYISADERAEREEKALQATRRIEEQLRAVIEDSALLDVGARNAQARIEEFKELSAVWKGTKEEKARGIAIEKLEVFVRDEVARRGRVLPERRAGK